MGKDFIQSEGSVLGLNAGGGCITVQMYQMPQNSLL